MRQRPCHMVNGERLVDILRFRGGVAALGGIEGGFHDGGDPAKADLAVEEGRHRDLVRGIEDGRGCATGFQRPGRYL